jgi:hypothetical protein
LFQTSKCVVCGWWGLDIFLLDNQNSTTISPTFNNTTVSYQAQM